jgi:hypothetical protein
MAMLTFIPGQEVKADSVSDFLNQALKLIGSPALAIG